MIFVVVADVALAAVAAVAGGVAFGYADDEHFS